MIDPCKDPSLLSALIDGELSTADSEAVQKHLQGCGACRRQLAVLEQNEALLKQMPALEPSAEFNRTFWEKVDQFEQRSARHQWLRYLFTGWRPLLAGGLAGLAAAVFIAFGPQKALTPEEIFIAENIELLDEFDLIDKMDLLRSWEALEAMQGQT